MEGAALAVSLEEFGLSRYEAIAYVALLGRGTSRAGDLAFHAGIPRPKVYPTLQKMQKKGLVTLSQGKPVTCTAVPPEDAFDGVIHEQIERVNAMNSLVSGLKRAGEEGRRGRGAEEKRYLEVTAGGVPERLASMVAGAKESVRAVADQWGLGLLAGCRDQLASAARRGVEVRIVVQPSQVGTDAFRKIPAGAEVRASDVVQNFAVFDGSDVVAVDGASGTAAVFASAGVLAAEQERTFAGVWRQATRTGALADMTKSEAQEIYRIIRTVGDQGLPHLLGPAAGARRHEPGMLGLLEGNGISLKSRPLDEVIEVIDAVMQITCSGSAAFEAGARSITVESRINGGHSLPWVSILDGCLSGQGYRTRTVYQGGHSKGERAHIRIAKS